MSPCAQLVQYINSAVFATVTTNNCVVLHADKNRHAATPAVQPTASIQTTLRSLTNAIVTPAAEDCMNNEELTRFDSNV